RVPAVGELRRVLASGLDALEEDVDGDALPLRVELRPLGDAVDVLGDHLARQRDELLPRLGLWLVDLAGDAEGPLFQVGARRRPCRQHGLVVDHVLAGRQSPAVGGLAPLAVEAAADEPHPCGQLSTFYSRKTSRVLRTFYQIARMRLFLGLCSTSARPSASRSGGMYMPKRPRRPFFKPYQPPTGFFGDRPHASTVPSAAGFCSSALPSGIQSPCFFSIAARSSIARS